MKCIFLRGEKGDAAMSEDFEEHALMTSRERAQRAQTRTRIDGNIIKDFTWKTGRWYWRIHRECGLGKWWNQEGGTAPGMAWKKTYWLCLGWSRIEVLPEPDPVDTLQNGGLGNG